MSRAMSTSDVARLLGGRKPRQRPEADLQRACIRLLAMLPAPPTGPYWTAINPAPPKGRIQGAIAKSLGAKAGVPDLLIIYRGRPIFVELKAAKGRLSDVQKAASREITLAGALWAEVRSVDEFLDLIETVGIEGQKIRRAGE